MRGHLFVQKNVEILTELRLGKGTGKKVIRDSKQVADKVHKDSI